jgi:predicted DNA binding CopG/RHH family protein
MDETRGITVKIDAALHAEARADQEANGMTMSQYITMVLEEHFSEKKGCDNMNGNTRTMAFQVDEALFQRIKAHLHRTGLSQKNFVIGLIEQALAEAEAQPAAEDAEVQPGETEGDTQPDSESPTEDAAPEEDISA